MAQRSYDPLDFIDNGSTTDLAVAHKMALKARNEELRSLRAIAPATVGKFKGWALTGQLRKYSGLGQEDGRVRTVYYISGPDAFVQFGSATRHMRAAAPHQTQRERKI